MKLNTTAFAIAHTVIVAILFTICSFLVAFLPETTTSFTQYALHTDLSGVMRPFTFSGFIVGLVVTSLGWGLSSLIVAAVYNRLIKNPSSTAAEAFVSADKSVKSGSA